MDPVSKKKKKKKLLSSTAGENLSVGFMLDSGLAHMVLRMWLWRRMSLLWACEPGAEVFRGELSRRLHMERRGKMLTVGEAKWKEWMFTALFFEVPRV